MRPRLGIARVMQGAGNATQYQASVFKFARTWESIYLNFDRDAPAVPVPPSLTDSAAFNAAHTT